MESSLGALKEKVDHIGETTKATERHLRKIESVAHENTGMLKGLLAAFKIKLPERAPDKEPEV